MNDSTDALRKNGESGRGPSRSLYDKSITDKLCKSLKEAGIEPVSSLWERFNFSNIPSSPNCDGIPPVNELWLRSSTSCRLISFPI
ncbi:hypothetical protein QJS10_CPB21g00129 [Acorus calamus]|uniref:Uncharacterized protein n=1 Tax=Acorus calamus TaxID=4465 RepID=A0AAV9C673_ACOCL|nr:hypothetical protein QJS10_CPB21g00129 [Acorus calamus]